MDDPIANIWLNLTNKFGKAPKLVLSVIGDSKSFVPRAWPKSVFQRALIETGKSSGGDTWILYRNKDVGVSKIIADAYKNYLTMDRKRNPNAQPQIRLLGLKSPFEAQVKLKSTKGERDEIYLPNELELEEFVLKQKAPVNVYNKEDLSFKMPIPFALILLEGDLDSIKHVTNATSKGIPVIIIKGSGKAADVILDYLESDPNIRDHNLRRQAALLFGLKFQDSTFDQMVEDMKKLSEKRWMVTQFDSEKDDPLYFPKLVGETVVKGWALENIDRGNVRNVDVLPQSNMSTEKVIPDTGDIPGPFHYITPFEDTTSSSAIVYLCQENYIIKGKEVGSNTRPIASWEALRTAEDNTEKISSLLRSVNNTIHSNPNFTSPACLPLDFFYVYQVLQENDKVEKYGHALLLEALKSNRCDYVKVLMDNGVTIKLKDLQELYRSTIFCPKHDNKKSDNTINTSKKPETVGIMGTHEDTDDKTDTDETVEICKCLGMMWLMKRIDKTETKRCFYKTTKDESQTSEAATAICRELLDYQGNKRENKDAENLHEEGMKDLEKSCGDHASKDVTLDDILLWALYANRPQIAELVWLQDKNQLMKGLVSYEILRKLSEMAGDVKESNLSNELLDHAQRMYKRTQDLLDVIYDTEPETTMKLINEPVYIWGIRSSPLTFAYENFMYEFIAKPASQKFLNEIWYNSLAPDFIPWAKSLCTDPLKVIQSPLMKYIFNYVLFLSMLICYSGFVTTSVKTKYYVRDVARVLEYYVYFWGFGDLLEEFFSCFGIFHEDIEGKSIRSNWALVKRYLNNFWNLVDILSYALLVTALFVRHFHLSELEEFTIARRMFSLSLLIMYLRFLEAFLMSRALGPTLIMIKEMLKDLLGFISLMIVVILGVGFYYHANLWPDHAEFWKGNWINWRIWKVLYYPYWQLYGETFHEFLGGDEIGDCSSNFTEWSSDPSIERCPVQDWTVLAVSAFYMLFSNLLLVNLVIAMFSSTYERVTANAENLWRFERYSVITNYKCRIPSPINLPWLVIRILKQCGKKSSMTHPKKENDKGEFDESFQRIMAYEVSDKLNNNVN